MPPVLTVEFLTRSQIPSLIPVYGNSCSSRLKKLEKGDRRVFPKLVVLVMETTSVDTSSSSENLCNALKMASLDEIGLTLSESLHIGDGSMMESDNPIVTNDDSLDNLVENDKTMGTKSAKFICSGKLLLSTNFTDEKNGESVNDTAAEIKLASCESSETAHTRSISLPTSIKLVSALKGTREKLGAPRDKLSVTWAPDVYDPPPSAPSTAVINPKHRRKSERKKNIDNKKNGKNKQKKRSSKASSSSSSSKDKTAIHKYYKGNNVFYKSFESGEKMEVEGFDCGTTFLKASVTNLHFSLAEAT